ncbi:MAG: hypothetical protein IH986_12595 [Planctomycetes bacterium]|nr:hypothetical protein [Planctomycetota bacterium]
MTANALDMIELVPGLYVVQAVDEFKSAYFDPSPSYVRSDKRDPKCALGRAEDGDTPHDEDERR